MSIINKHPKTILFALFFFWMFPPSLNIFGYFNFNFYIISIVIPSIFGFLIYFKKGNGTWYINNILISIIVGFFAVLAYFIFGLVQNILDFYILKLYLLSVVTIFSCYFLIHRHKEIYKQDYIYNIFKNLFLIGLIHSALIIATAIFPDFSQALYQIVNITDKQEKFLSEVLIKRYSGLLQTGFSALSLTHALLLIAGIIFYWKYDRNLSLYRTLLYFISFAIMFISIMLIGRTGILIFFVFLVLFFIYQINQAVLGLIINKKILYFVFLLFILIFTTVFFIDLSTYQNQIDSSFEIFISFINSGEFSSASTDQIINNELLFPDGITLLFGSGNFGLGTSRIPSDVGFVYLVNGMGIIGTILIFGPYLISLIYAYQERHTNFILFLFLLFLVVILIPLNLKDFYFLGFGGHFKVFLVIAFIFHFLRLDNKLNKSHTKKISSN